MKYCCRAGACRAPSNLQPLDAFAIDRKRKDGRTPACKACLKAYRDENKAQRAETIKRWRVANPEKMAAYRKAQMPKTIARMRKWRDKNRMQSLYGISNRDRNEMFDRQKGRCAICQRHSDNFKRGLCVDHDHAFGNVRGLLCHPCNQALGLLKDDATLFRRAIKYLS